MTRAGDLFPARTLGAVLVNHNSRGTILEAVQRLKTQTFPPVAVVVVDNASSDGMPAAIRAQHPDIQLIALKENAGLSRARNLGWRALQTDCVVFLDDDVYLEQSALETMMSAMEQAGAGVVCPRVALFPEIGAVQCDGAEIHFTGVLRQLPGSASPEAFETPAFIGACALIRREVLADLRGFDEDYFFYFEDLELSYRLVALGHRILCEPRAVAYHDRGAGTVDLSFRGTGTYPSRRAYYVLRNRWLTILLHYQARTLVILAPALALYELAALAECLRRGWLYHYLTACLWLVRSSASILRRRRTWMALRRKRDAHILRGGQLPFAAGFVQGRLQTMFVRILGRILNAYWEAAKAWL